MGAEVDKPEANQVTYGSGIPFDLNVFIFINIVGLIIPQAATLNCGFESIFCVYRKHQIFDVVLTLYFQTSSI
jgi:hypothetical protein